MLGFVRFPLRVLNETYQVFLDESFLFYCHKYLKNNYPNAKVTLSEAVPYLVADSSNTSTEIVCLLTNISDKNAEPIKSILAKQLQEVLPINIVVTPENIIGCALDE